VSETNHTLVDELRKLGELEKRVIGHVLHRKHVARDPNATFDEQMSLGERVADRVASFGGSWTFISIFVGLMTIWMIINVVAAFKWDEYPFILLNLVLSCLAALQAPVIMMSQNRQSKKDRIDASHDYEVNLKAETEIVALHLKMDELRERQWATLMEVQAKQLELLTRLEGLAKKEGLGGLTS
jgi:uncharacterized membrane protein